MSKWVKQFVAVLLLLAAFVLAGDDDVPNALGVVGGSIPVDGIIPATEILLVYAGEAGNYRFGRQATTPQSLTSK